MEYSETGPSTRAYYKFSVIALAASPRCLQRQDLLKGVHVHSLFDLLRLVGFPDHASGEDARQGQDAARVRRCAGRGRARVVVVAVLF